MRACVGDDSRLFPVEVLMSTVDGNQRRYARQRLPTDLEGRDVADTSVEAGYKCKVQLTSQLNFILLKISEMTSTTGRYNIPVGVSSSHPRFPSLKTGDTCTF